MGTVVHPEEGSEDATGKDCEGCLNHLATIQRLTDVIHEQASTIKDQQNSIASLIARVQAGGGPGNTTGKKSTAASAVSHASQDVEGKPKLPAENGNGGASARGRGRPRRSSISQTTTPVRQTKQEEEGSAAGGSQRGKRPISVRGPTAKRAPEAGKRSVHYSTSISMILSKCGRQRVVSPGPLCLAKLLCGRGINFGLVLHGYEFVTVWLVLLSPKMITARNIWRFAAQVSTDAGE